ncbi:MAG: response regulator [Rhodospirillales bacterium]|jgi:CheY-like chemotaxis protein|nr:response regulator [Rhodospirillales bacterium]MDK9722425.1 response regulator [Rhodospirillales bacterium]
MHESRNAQAFERLNCLIVDGNRHMRTILKGVLRAFGIRHIQETTDGAGAIRELKSLPIDIVITEYALDTLDGIDLSKLIRTASDSSNPLVPIIMLTGHTERHIVAQARDAGVNEFLAKPISAEALYVRIISAVFNPRPFVKAKGFMGPDRRRHQLKHYKGGEQRVAPPELIMPRIWQEGEGAIPGLSKTSDTNSNSEQAR